MQALKETATNAVNTITSTVSTMSLPKTYKAAVFETKGGPLVFKDFELKPPPAGEVSFDAHTITVKHMFAN